MLRGPRAFLRIATLVLVGAALEAAPMPARAYEEQASLDASLGYGLRAADDALPNHSTVVDLGATIGLSDWLVARPALGYGVLWGDKPVHVGRSRLEVAALLDVVQWVPFLGLGGGLWLLDGPPGLVTRPTGHVLFGIDYLLAREVTLGLDVRTGLLWQRGEPAFTAECQLRFSRMFELF